MEDEFQRLIGMKDNEFQDLIDKIYKGGNHPEVKRLIFLRHPDLSTAPVEVLNRLGWTEYKLYNLADAEKAFRLAREKEPKNLRANEGLAQVAMARFDEATVEEIATDFPGSHGVCNARISLAGDRNSDIPLGKVIEAALPRMVIEGLTPTHILVGAGKAIVARSEDPIQLAAAVGFLSAAIMRYGVEGYIDHRANAWGHLSRAYHALERLELALYAAGKSLELWDEQLTISATKEFLDKRDIANYWLKELKLLASASIVD